MRPRPIGALSPVFTSAASLAITAGGVARVVAQLADAALLRRNRSCGRDDRGFASLGGLFRREERWFALLGSVTVGMMVVIMKCLGAIGEGFLTL